MAGLIVIFSILYIISIVFVLALIFAFMSGNMDLSAIGIGPTLFFVAIFAFGTIAVVYSEKERARRTKGKECDAVCLEGLPGFKCEQALHLTLNLKDLFVLFSDRKETEVCLKFQQIIRLNYICWEGEVIRWKSGSNGYSYPGLFEGTRVYVPPTSGYSYTEKLKVDWALEIQYRDQYGLRDHIVLKIGRYDDYVDRWLETLCRCTNIPAPQYVEPVKPVKPGPTYL